jgi:hypothetical protein
LDRTRWADSQPARRTRPAGKVGGAHRCPKAGSPGRRSPRAAIVGPAGARRPRIRPGARRISFPGPSGANHAAADSSRRSITGEARSLKSGPLAIPRRVETSRRTLRGEPRSGPGGCRLGPVAPGRCPWRRANRGSAESRRAFDGWRGVPGGDRRLVVCSTLGLEDLPGTMRFGEVQILGRVHDDAGGGIGGDRWPGAAESRAGPIGTGGWRICLRLRFPRRMAHREDLERADDRGALVVLRRSHPGVATRPGLLRQNAPEECRCQGHQAPAEPRRAGGPRMRAHGVINDRNGLGIGSDARNGSTLTTLRTLSICPFPIRG